MRLEKKPIDWYVKRLENGEHFSFPGYSDAEWLSMLGERLGDKTGAGQRFTADIGVELLKTLHNDYDERWLPAAPQAINEMGISGRVDGLLKKKDIEWTFYERDMVTDDLARDAGLYPFIKQLREMDVYIVSNSHLRDLTFLNHKKFFETETLYNFHSDINNLRKMEQRILDFGKGGVYLFSVGMSSAVMISRLHDKMQDSFLIDCGSIWDAFVGIGGQREWRANLYKNPEKHSEWIRKNLRDIPRE